MRRVAFVPCAGLLVLAACDRPTVSTEPPLVPSIDAELRQALVQWSVVPIDTLNAQDAARVELGQALVFDKLLSGNRDIACATCHHPSTHGADGLSLAIGTGGAGLGASRTLGAGREFVPRNAPSLLNQGLRSFYLLWDGRIGGHGSGPFESPPGITFPAGTPNTLAAQAMLPVLDRREMRGEPGDVDVFGNPNELAQIDDDQTDAIWRAIMQRLLAVPEYAEMFDAAFPQTQRSALAFRHATTALAAFITEAFTRVDSPFDRYLGGDDGALSVEAKRGALLFFAGRRNDAPQGAPAPVPFFRTCGSCHNGPLLGGQDFANVGVPQLGPGTGTGAPLDRGRGELLIARGEADQNSVNFYHFRFRVPPLRNVELTAPYMHNGAYATLEAVVRHYSDVPDALINYDVSQLSPVLRDRYHGGATVAGVVLSTLDHRLQTPFDFSEDEERDLVVFLRSLTDPAARDLRALIPERVPSGLPVER